MTRRRRLFALAVLVLALAASTLPLTGAAGAGRPDPSTVANNRLRSDADGRLTLKHGVDGRLRFAGVSGGVVDNPAVDGHDSVAAAARAHLDRYGAALGAAPGTTYEQDSTARTVAGTDLVRLGQRVDGVPVLGGEVVVGLGQGHDLRSMAADVTSDATVTDPTVTAAATEKTALGLTRRLHPHADLTVRDLGRWVLDPQVTGLDLPGGVRTIRRLEVGDDAGIRELVLVDDHTGHVLFRTSLIENADRVVCDDVDARSAQTPCTSNFARSAASGPSVIADVNNAYDYAQEVSDFYTAISGGQIDLTQLLGVDVSGTQKLAATVRFCSDTMTNGVNYDDPCPYANAFWNGTQMFYGDGFASADDVVGHEMTHGVIDQFSQLFYWGQSGAINESMADVMGELIDHRNGTDDDSAWNLGEDLPGGALRNMKDPTLDGQPDRMTSSAYTADDVTYGDNGGVHTNSGVGNKTAYLISQGTGATPFNGQSFLGIDAGDPSLTKTATLYLDVIESLASGADYADLAAQLEQSCADLVATARAGFSSADCAVVHQAVLATELTTTPTNAAQPADADVSCPTGTTKRVLLDSESGTSAEQQSRFSTVTTSGMTAFTWSTSSWGSNATSGQASWFVPDQRVAGQSLLYATSPTDLPAGQPSYLTFQGWNLLDYDSQGNYDGGLVDINIDNQTNHYDGTTGWINGPTGALASGTGNLRGGYRAFVGDSRGWVRSRYDLSAWAGHQVTPRFSLFTDADTPGYDFSMVGWYLDDIAIYTCDPASPPPPPAPTSAVQGLSVAGSVSAMTVTWAPPATNPEAVTGYRVDVSPCTGYSRSLPATARSTTLVISSQLCGGVVVVSVVPTTNTQQGSPRVSVTVRLGMTGVHARRSGTHVRFRGVVGTTDGHRVAGGLVRISRKTAAGWITVRTVTTGSSGAYTATITRRRPALYRVAYLGGPFLIGSHHKDLRL